MREPHYYKMSEYPDSESCPDNTTIFFLILIGLVIFFIYSGNNKTDKTGDDNTQVTNTEHFHNGMMDGSREHKKYKQKKHRKHTGYGKRGEIQMHDVNYDELYEKMKGSNKPHTSSGSHRLSGSSKSMKHSVNPEFIEQQYHKDYNDTITAINGLTNQKDLFNHGFLPVKESEPNPANVRELVKLFMNKLNTEVHHNVTEYLHVNSGWSDHGKRRREKSGFEEQMEELGLPGTLYTEPADKAKVRLIKIDKTEKFSTDDQIRFIIMIIIQKENVSDQMVLRLQFFMEKEDLHNNRDDRANFFEKGLSNSHNTNDTSMINDAKVIIEQVFTEGFLTNGKNKSKMDGFHDYGNIMRVDGIMDQRKLLQVMKKKHAERSKELSSFMCSLDDETKQIHDVPGLDSYASYQNARTILDDLKQFPENTEWSL